MNTIDYVVPMVFNSDIYWREDLVKAGKRYDETNLAEFVRYRSWGTERLLIRCVKKFMPFVRNIFVILSRESQKQDWMDEEGVKVVYHKDFIPDKYLPTFNSRTIEMFLKNIPGISERFLYGNDDMFPVSELKEEDFFEGNLPCVHCNEKPYPVQPNAFHIAALGGLNFIAHMFGKRYTTTWLKSGHSITPMVKTTWEFLWETYESELAGRITPFRQMENFNQWLCPWWHFLSGQCVDKAQNRKYVSVRNTPEEVRNTLLHFDGIVCVNDNECVADYMRYGEAVKSALEERLKG